MLKPYGIYQQEILNVGEYNCDLFRRKQGEHTRVEYLYHIARGKTDSG